MENPKIDSHKNAQLFFDKGAKVIQWNWAAFPINSAGAIEYLLTRTMTKKPSQLIQK